MGRLAFLVMTCQCSSPHTKRTHECEMSEALSSSTCRTDASQGGRLQVGPTAKAAAETVAGQLPRKEGSLQEEYAKEDSS